MSNKLKIPVKQFRHFIESSGKWLTKTVDHKTSGLEVAVEAVDSEITLSVGGDSSFFRVSFEIDKLETPFERVFVDLGYLLKIPFEKEEDDSETFSLTKPLKIEDIGKVDNRVAIRYKGMNYKIPIKNGDVWEKNKHDFDKHEVNSFIDLKERSFFNQVYTESILPSSFGIKHKNVITFHKKPEKEGVFIYSSDGFGAFCHNFKDELIEFSEGITQVDIDYEFFVPMVKISEIEGVKIYTSDRYLLGSARSTVFTKFHWVQPKTHLLIEDIESFVAQSLTEEKTIVKLGTKDFLNIIKNSMVFFKESNIRDTPLQFLAIGDKYTMSAALPHTHSMIEGELLQNQETPVRVMFQAASIRDYVSMLDNSHEMNMEVYSTKVILEQKLENFTMKYLLPISSR